jgi:uncharacterized protein
MRALLALLLTLATALGALPALAAPEFPELTGRVVDAADVIPPEVEARLDEKLAALETQSQRQLVIATLPSLQGYEISDYGYQLGRAWGIGDEERNDGALLIVAPNEKKLRIEVGYGLEPILTDGFSSDVINQIIVPHFKAGDLPGGIEAGTDAIIHQIQLPPAEARRIAAAAERPDEPKLVSLFPFIVFAIILFLFVLPVLGAIFGRKGRRRYRSRGLGNIVLWGVAEGLGSMARSSGSGSSWGGSISSGGFSGGGGSFGGGGASGSW